MGNPHWLSYTRSTLKALQALPFVMAGGPRHFGFNPQQVALLCASHNGEDSHVAQVQGMLDKAGLTYKALQCGCHVPHLFTALEEGAAARLRVRRAQPQLQRQAQRLPGLLRAAWAEHGRLH